MKKLFIFVLSFFISAAVFAEDYSVKLFSWDKNYSDVVRFFIDLEWSMRLDKENQFLYFTPTKNNFFYQNKLLKIKEMFFSFDGKGNITSQNITLDNDYTLEVAFMALLTEAIIDSATFYDQDYEKEDGIDHLGYYAHLPDCNLYSVIAGRDDYYMVFLCYSNEF